VVLVGRPIAGSFHTKWPPINHKSSAVQGKSAGRGHRAASQPSSDPQYQRNIGGERLKARAAPCSGFCDAPANASHSVAAGLAGCVGRAAQRYTTIAEVI